MEKSKLERMISQKEISDKSSISTSSKTQINLDFSDLIKELTEINQEGDSLFNKSEFEQAINKYLQGYNLFEKETEKSYNLYCINHQVEKMISLYKGFLSKISECFYEQKKYDEAIVYDLQLICFEPKNVKSIVRLFLSYSKIGKYQQAEFYGEIYQELDKEAKNKYKDIQKDIDIIKRKLKNIRTKDKNKFNKIFFNFIIVLVVLISAFFFYSHK